MTREAAMAHLDTYLAQVRRYLKGLSEAETSEVLLELRAHVLDRVEGQMTPSGVEAALAALGSPREVARINVTERVAAVLERDRSFFGVLSAVVRLAGLSVAGFFLLMVSLIGYGLSAVFLIVAAWKPFQPEKVGLWRQTEGSDKFAFSLGVVDHPAAGHELLGWWIIPVGLVAGLAFGYLTWSFGRFCVRAMGRGRRRSLGAV
jgi:hypothetical protein